MGDEKVIRGYVNYKRSIQRAQIMTFGLDMILFTKKVFISPIVCYISK